MDTVKTAAFAGKFYPCDREKLDSLLENLLKQSVKDYRIKTRAIIVPHAGYMYSAKTATTAFQYIDTNTKNFFIIAPSHTTNFSGLAVPSFDYFETPCGNIKVNKALIYEIAERKNADFFDEAFEKEHSIEVELPFLKKISPDAQIVPVLYGKTDTETIAKLIDDYWINTGNSFVISSDLSHFYSIKDVEKIDNYTAEMIETQNINNFHPLQACGSTGITGLVQFCTKNNFSMIRTALTNSGETAGTTETVVGYGAWILTEESKSNFIKNQFPDMVISICKESILAGIKTGNSLDVEEKLYPQVFYESGACFVTITINERLRGCIGSIFAHKPLLNDLAQNAYKSAFADTRFTAITEEEFEHIKIAVSLLSEPQPLEFSDEEDLLSKIVPYKDGIIIQDNGHSAVYLPSVWVQLPDKKDFLNSLKQKAGLSPDYFSKTLKAYRFYTVYIDE